MIGKSFLVIGVFVGASATAGYFGISALDSKQSALSKEESDLNVGQSDNSVSENPQTPARNEDNDASGKGQITREGDNLGSLVGEVGSPDAEAQLPQSQSEKGTLLQTP